MKVMIIAPYIYDPDMPEFTRNKTGFGIMVHNIVKTVGEYEEVVLLTRAITSGGNNSEKSYKVLSHTWKQIFFNTRLNDWLRGARAFALNSRTLKDRIRCVFYELDGGYFKRLIRKEQPDIVHIHGIGTITQSYIRICEEMKIKYAVTLHGLIGLNASISASEREKQIERDFLVNAAIKNVPVSVISSGMKTRIEKYYLKSKATNINVITNGTAKSRINRMSTIYKKGHLDEQEYLEKYCTCLSVDNSYPKLEDTFNYLEYSKNNGKRILYYVGNITKNKNQIQAVEMFRNNKEFQNSILVLWGREVDGGEVRKKIIEYKLERRIILGGFNNEMNCFWKICDLNLFFSMNDGFGLPIIEGYMHGIPCVTFEDLDATEDLFYPEAMIKVKDRNVDAITNAVKVALNKSWNQEEIVKIGTLFSIETMAKTYIKWYENIIKQQV